MKSVTEKEEEGGAEGRKRSDNGWDFPKFVKDTGLWNLLNPKTSKF